MSTNRMTGPDAVLAVNIAITKAKTIDDVPCHPVAAMFPLIEGDEWEAFKADIAANGLRQPIVIDHQGRIVDGRNRARAIIELGIRAPTLRCQVQDFIGDDIITKYIVSMNITRRQLTTSQRIALAAELANLSHGGDRRSDQGVPVHLEKPMTIAKAAEAMDVSVDAVKQYKAADVKGENPEAHAAVKSGAMTAKAAVRETRERTHGKAPQPAQKRAVVVDASQSGPSGIAAESVDSGAGNRAPEPARTFEDLKGKVSYTCERVLAAAMESSAHSTERIDLAGLVVAHFRALDAFMSAAAAAQRGEALIRLRDFVNELIDFEPQIDQVLADAGMPR